MSTSTELQLSLAYTTEKMEPKTPVHDTTISDPVESAFVSKNDVDEVDDDCAICYQTLYRPATTECGHSACQSCMLHWAMTAMEVCGEETEIPTNLEVDGMRFSCPACRTSTTATLDIKQNDRLQKQYPDEYKTRAAEEAAGTVQQDEYAIQNMVLVLGNSHRDIESTFSPITGEDEKHEWTFFIQSSHKDVIEQIQVILHPRFREHRLVTLKTPPFSVTHLGWHYFTIHAGIQLKQGWEWVDESMAVDIDKTRRKARLPVQWLLDFRRNGVRKTQLVKFRKVMPEPEVNSDEEELDLDALALVMSPSEIRNLKATIKAKNAAKKLVAQLEKPL